MTRKIVVIERRKVLIKIKGAQEIGVEGEGNVEITLIRLVKAHIERKSKGTSIKAKVDENKVDL
jgi:hypothetical protein